MSLAKPQPRERTKQSRPMPKCECGHGYRKHLVLAVLGGGAEGCKYVSKAGDVCPCSSYRRPRVSVQRASAPIKLQHKYNRQPPKPRCKNCSHPYSKHSYGAAPSKPACLRCAACPGYEPKRKTRSDKKPRGMRESDLGRAKRTLWKRFAAYVKARDGNVCFTCDAVVTGCDLQAGHMFPGRTGALLYDPLVVFSQCSDCNRGKRGNTPVFVRRYVERFGIEQFQAAVARTSREKQWRTHEVRELIAALRKGGADYETLYMEKHGLSAVGGAQ